jgi:hypothetical protein
MTIRNVKIALYLGTLGKSRKSLLNVVGTVQKQEANRVPGAELICIFSSLCICILL